MVSNQAPHEFPLFRDDQAILDKLIKVKFGPEVTIPSQFQISNMTDFIESVCADIFHWAVYCNKNILKYFLRAVD